MSAFPHPPRPVDVELGARLLDTYQSNCGADTRSMDHRHDREAAQVLLSGALADLMHFTAETGADLQAALDVAHMAYASARGGVDLCPDETVTDGQRRGYVTRIPMYALDNHRYEVRFLGEADDITVPAGDLQRIPPPSMDLGRGWEPALREATQMLASFQVQHDLLTSTDSPLPAGLAKQEGTRQKLLDTLSSWGNVSPEQLLAGMAPFMERVRPTHQAMFRAAGLLPAQQAAEDFPNPVPPTHAPAPSAVDGPGEPVRPSPRRRR